MPGPEHKRWWVDEKFLSCIKQLFFPLEPRWKPRRTRALCWSCQPQRSGHVPSPASVPTASTRSGLCFGG